MKKLLVSILCIVLVLGVFVNSSSFTWDRLLDWLSDFPSSFDGVIACAQSIPYSLESIKNFQDASAGDQYLKWYIAGPNERPTHTPDELVSFWNFNDELVGWAFGFYTEKESSAFATILEWFQFFGDSVIRFVVEFFLDTLKLVADFVGWFLRFFSDVF